MHEEYKTQEEIDFFTCQFSDKLHFDGVIDCINWCPSVKYPCWCKIGYVNCIKKEKVIIPFQHYKQMRL
jgi:hypothetical protein